jgi:hypothetical protein
VPRMRDRPQTYHHNGQLTGKMRRRRVKSAFGSALLVFSATAIAWSFSYFHLEGFDFVWWDGPRAQIRAVHIVSYAGELGGEARVVATSRDDWARLTESGDPAPGVHHFGRSIESSERSEIRGPRRLGFPIRFQATVIENHPGQFPSRIVRIRRVRFPWWAVAILLGLTAAVPLARLAVVRRRLARGLCLSCGYDLRASTGRCPECGRTNSEPQPTGA